MNTGELKKKEYRIAGVHGRPITLDVTRSVGPIAGAVVFCHGFKGFKDWGHFNTVAGEFASKGLAFIKFNFSHNGTTPDHLIDFVDLEAFANNNYSKELDDLGLVLDWVETYFKGQEALFVMGHSRGGGIAILKTAEDPRVRKLVTWSAVSDFIGRFPDDIERFQREKVVYIPNSRTNQNMPLHYQFVEDYYANESRLNIQDRLIDVDVPYLIVHGAEDEAVPVGNAADIHAKCKTSRLQYIGGAGHTFGAAHPFNGSHLPAHAQQAVDISIDFFLGTV